MECLNPYNILNPNTTIGGRLNVPCGKCARCVVSKRNEWSFRLWQESKIAKSAVFVTLTYNDEHLPINDEFLPTLDKTDLQLFHKRLRKHQDTKTKEKWKIRYYAVGEYGTKTQRPHYHAMYFNIAPLTLQYITKIWSDKDKKPIGNVDLADCNPATIRYLTKYVINKPGEYQSRKKPFAIMSRRPGLGANYIREGTKKYHNENNLLTVKNENGVIQPMPRFLSDKLFDPHEKKRITKENIKLGRMIERTKMDAHIEKGTIAQHFRTEQENRNHSVRQLKKKINKSNKI